MLSWFTGDLTPNMRVFTALLPAIVVSAYFLIGYAVYAIRTAVWGEFTDPESASRGRTALMGYHLRYYFFWIITPLWRLILASGISANGVTAIAGMLGVGAATACAYGRFALGGWLFLFSGILDALDGRVARARNQVTPAGAAIDSILDRYTDSLMLVGLGLYYRQSWVLIFVFAALVGTSIVPYVRAKSEALGFPIRDGLMQRAERLLYFGGAVALAPIFEALVFPHERHPQHWLAIAGIVFLAITSNLTAISRFRKLVRAMTVMSGGPVETTNTGVTPAPAPSAPAPARPQPTSRHFA
jgi:phosphatidylglycerophosphate synthase